MLLLAGCGSGRIPISGDVTFNGEPILTGTITFEPADDKGVATGGKIVSGKYALVGDAAPQPGKKKVRIVASRKTGRRIQAQFAAPRHARGRNRTLHSRHLQHANHVDV